MRLNLNQKVKMAVLVAAAVVFAAGCGGSDVNVNVRNASKLTSVSAAKNGLNYATAGSYGSAEVGDTGLSSFKYYIKQIRICDDLGTTPGSTAYNSPVGCSTLYENSADNYDTFGYNEALAAGSDKYIDILNATERAKLKTTASIDPGNYHVGIIDWYKPVKFTAQVTNATGGTTYYTKSGGTFTTGAADSNGYVQIYTLITGITTAPAQEVVAVMNNGGNYFRFGKEFVAERGETYDIDLAFNLANRVKAGPEFGNTYVQDASMNGFYTPMLDIVPVPRKTTEQTMVETYTITGFSQATLRIQVYYLSSDADKNIQAVDIVAIPTAATTSNVTDIYKPWDIVKEGSSYSFKDYQGKTFISGFTRNAAGGTFTFHNTGTTYYWMPSGDTTLTYAAPAVGTFSE